MKKINKLLLVLLAALMLVGCNTKKEEQKENKKEEEKKPELVYLDNYMNKDPGLYGIYEDGSSKLISKDVAAVSFTVDGDTVYYTLRGQLYSLDLSKEGAEPKSYDINIDVPFSVVDGKLHYIVRASDKEKTFVANSVDLNGGTEEKNTFKLNNAHVQYNPTGKVFYLDDNYHVSVSAYYYAYDFATKELTKLGDYDYIIEEQVNYILFKKDKNNYCIVDKKTNKETFCQKMAKPSNNIYDTFPTSHNGNIVIIENGKIKECTGEDKCEKELYTLTDAEKKAPYLGMRYIGEHLYLTVGENETCEGGCTYDYATYDVLNEHKKADFTLPIEGYNQGLFLK